MKLNLCYVYCALLFISCISSCILFLLVAAENGIVLGSGSPTTTTTATAGNATADVTGKQSVTNNEMADSEAESNDESGEMNSQLLNDEHPDKEIHSSIEDLSLSREQPVSEESLQADPVLTFQQPSVNNEISDSGQGAVVFTLVDTATSELQQKVAASSSVSSTTTNGRAENKTIPLAVPVPLPSESDAPNAVNNVSQQQQQQQQYVVRAQPKQVDPGVKSDHMQSQKQDEVTGEQQQQLPLSEAEQNDTLPQPPAPPPPATQHVDTSASQEDIPSFSEWAQKQLAEAEKKRGENTTGGSGIISGGGLKMRNKNYASPDCGAKVVAANPEAVSAGAVLSPSRDEYLLNTCNSRIWFVVELCEAIQPRKIELANFELFSSPPRDFSVWLSDRMPTRDWTSAGKYTAQDERTIQAFNLDMPPAFGKYVKVEIHSHYGAEHYCPVSLFRVYGTSEFEVLDTVDEVHHTPDDDDDDLMIGDSGEAPKNLFGSARDAVLSIVKKAAEVLVKTPEGEEQSSFNETVSNVTDEVKTEECITPSYIVVCDNCSDELFHRVHNLISCYGSELEKLLSNPFVCSAMKNSELCTGLGLDLKAGHAGAPYPLRQATSLHSEPHPIEYLQMMLKAETLAALCNILAIAQKKVAHNVTYGSPHETTNETGTETTTGSVEAPLLIQPESTCSLDATNTSPSPQPPSGTSDFSTTLPYSGVDHDPTLPRQIRPTKTLTKEENLSANVEVINQHHNVTESGMNHSAEKSHTVVSPTQTVAINISEGVENNSATADSPLTVMELPEDTTADSLSLDSLISELEEAVVDTNNGRPPTQHVTPPQLVQKESVFVRLANRIKALERNMSLSGQYLEELSRRYKRQVEEMQKALAGAMEERKRGEEREEKRKEQLSHLTEQVAALTLAVETLLNERDSWQHKASVLGQHGVIILVEVIVFAIVLCVCRWLPEVEVSRRRFSVAWPRSRLPPERRKSVDGVTGHVPPRMRKRRPSEEALRISGSTHQELLIPDNIRQNQFAKNENRRRRRKRKELAAKMTGLEIDSVKRPLLERNSAESILVPWWGDEDINLSSPSIPSSLQTQLSTVSAPAFIQTALSHRQERISRAPSSEVSIDSVKEQQQPQQKQTFLPIKKSGPFKKIVKKFF